MSLPETVMLCAPAESGDEVPEHAVEMVVAPSLTRQVAASTPELTPPATGSVMLQVKVNGALKVPEAGFTEILGAVLSTVIRLLVPFVLTIAPVFSSAPLAEPPKLSVPSPLAPEQV